MLSQSQLPKTDQKPCPDITQRTPAVDFMGDQCSMSAERNEHYSPSLLIEFDGFRKLPLETPCSPSILGLPGKIFLQKPIKEWGEFSASKQGESRNKIQEDKRLKSSASHVLVSCSDFFPAYSYACRIQNCQLQ